MLNHTVTCDACSVDLTETPFSRDFRIAVSVETIPNTSGASTDVFTKRPLAAGPYHFCSLPCLTRWVGSNPEDAS